MKKEIILNLGVDIIFILGAFFANIIGFAMNKESTFILIIVCVIFTIILIIVKTILKNKLIL